MIALVVGHERRAKGAMNQASGLTEFDFNDGLVNLISALLCVCSSESSPDGDHIVKPPVPHEVVYREVAGGYRQLPGYISSLQPAPELVVSFHCNAFNSKASGTETLHYYRSLRGFRAADIFQRAIVDCLRLPDRGVKARSSEDRGGYLLSEARAPCVILEPFFIDNDSDLASALESYNDLASAIAGACRDALDAVRRTT